MPESDFERMPPHDIAAEQCVLGGMLLAPSAITDVIDIIGPDAHYRPAHTLIHEAILDLFARGEPADAITVANLLTQRGDITRVGGAVYLHTCISAVPTAANAGYYAKIVRERKVLRRLIETGTRITQYGYQADADADTLVNRAQADVFGLTTFRDASALIQFGDLMLPAGQELEEAAERALSSETGVIGIPTGLVDLDKLLNGLYGGQLIMIAARPALGKALTLDTPLPTPGGWTTMGDVREGDLLLGADGKPTRVVATTETMTGHPCYEVEFSDGEVIVADENHQWLTSTRDARKYRRGLPEIVTTGEIARTVRCGSDQRANHAIAVAAPLALPDATLPVPPYVLGAWLGDGHSASARLTTADPEIVAHIEAAGIVAHQEKREIGYRLAFQPETLIPEERTCVVCGKPFMPKTQSVRSCGRSCGAQAQHTPPVKPPTCRKCGIRITGWLPGTGCCRDCGTLQGTLRKLGLLGNKHIPAKYLRASERQRRELLAGLLDTDGTVVSTGNIQFAVVSRRLAYDVRELVASLGYRCSIATKRVKGRSESSSICYIVNFTTADTVFQLSRKQIAHKERYHGGERSSRRRFITAVRPVSSRPVRCVQVDNADHLYLAGRGMIPTHNSTLGVNCGQYASKHGYCTAIFSLEMGRIELATRILSAEARVPHHTMRSGRLNDDEWTRIARRMGDMAHVPLWIDDTPGLSLAELRAKCRLLKSRNDLRLVIVDYLQLMTTVRRKDSNRAQEVGELSTGLKILAKELDVPVVALSQLNRGPETRHDKKPMLSDLRESGNLEQDSDVVILLHREDAYERESPRAGEADLIVAKHRNGPVATVTAAFQGHYCRFVDMGPVA